MQRPLLLFSLFIFFLFPQTSFAQNCMIDTLVPNVPGIYPDSFPPMNGCQYNEQDVTFVFPRDTVVNVAGQNIRIPFNSFTITNVTGLPLGINWKCNLSPNCMYDVSPNNPMPDTVGCVQFYGTPGVPGIYTFVVDLDVVLPPPLGAQQTTYTGTIEVTACTFVGSCYTYSLSDNCEPAVLGLTNNIPSNGKAGFSYLWEIGGPGHSFSTTDENPLPQVITDGGTYTIDYELVVDTIGFILDSVRIDTVNCSDVLIGVDPDLYWILKDPGGMDVVNTSSSPLNNFNQLPLNIGVPAILLDTGAYELQVWDDDTTSPDDGCADGQNQGSASVFLNIPPTSPGPVVVTNGGLQVTFFVSNPKMTISCSDTFHLDTLPVIPDLMALGDTFFCKGDSVELMTTSTDSLVWFMNGLPITGASGSSYFVKTPGNYSVQSVNRTTRCTSAQTQPMTFTEVTVPTPSINLIGQQTIEILNPDPRYIYVWYVDQLGPNPVDTTTSYMINGTGRHWAVAIDIATGCVSDTSGNITIVLSSLEDLVGILEDFRFFPNPFKEEIQVGFTLVKSKDVKLRVMDLMGRVVFQNNWENYIGEFHTKIDLNDHANGLYVLECQIGTGVVSRRIMKK